MLLKSTKYKNILLFYISVITANSSVGLVMISGPPSPQSHCTMMH